MSAVRQRIKRALQLIFDRSATHTLLLLSPFLLFLTTDEINLRLSSIAQRMTMALQLVSDHTLTYVLLLLSPFSCSCRQQMRSTCA
jgi:hypothetical protein